MTQDYLDTIEQESAPSPTAAVIWLHGLGADGNDFAGIVPELQLPKELAIRFVFPHAPVQPITINGGMPMRAWYDVAGIGSGYRDDEPGIRKSAQQIRDLVGRERQRGIAPDRIVLAGFSQGGAIALHAGLRMEQPLAGIMALSTYLPLADRLEAERHEASRGVPIFMAHGREDAVVPMDFAQTGARHLEGLGYALEWREYSMPHSVCMQELQDIRSWLLRIL